MIFTEQLRIRKLIEQFFKDLDLNWNPLGDEPIGLSVIGSTALFLQTDYQRGTTDTDFMEIQEISKASQIFGFRYWT